MKNLKISRKLFVAFSLVLLLLVACIAVGIYNLEIVKSEVATFHNGPFIVQSSANTIRTSFENMQKSVYRSMANTEDAIVNAAINDVDAASATIQAQMPAVREHFLGDQQIITNLEGYLAQLTVHREEVLKLSRENKNAQAAAYMEQNNIPIINNATAELEKLISSANTKGEELVTGIAARQNQAVFLLVLMGIISIALGIGFGAYITRGIVRPVAELETAAEQMANGNLKTDITYRSLDEMGSLAESLRKTINGLSSIIGDESYLLGEMAKGNFQIFTTAEESYKGDFLPILQSMRLIRSNLSDAMRQINQAAEQVSSGSEQVSNGAQALSQGAAEQASSVEELAATITAISSQVKSSAENAMQARTESNRVSDEMLESNRKMQTMVEAMGVISSSSGEIGKIIKTIEDIAFQTNILALNAAVEAARAGAAGKGFAVVADEVRNLAQKSAEASKNTSALIESSIRSVENGTKIADATAQSLITAVDGSKRIAELIAQISQASSEQANSLTQVTQGVDQISNVVQINTATAEESAAASEELSGQAGILKSLVAKFKLADTAAAAASSFSNAPMEPMYAGKYE